MILEILLWENTERVTLRSNMWRNNRFRKKLAATSEVEEKKGDDLSEGETDNERKRGDARDTGKGEVPRGDFMHLPVTFSSRLLPTSSRWMT